MCHPTYCLKITDPPQCHDHRSLSKTRPWFQSPRWHLGEFEGRWATRRQGGEWGTDARDGVRTGVSKRLPSKEDFMRMFNRNFTWLLMCLFTCLFRGALGMRKSVVSGSGRRQWFLFWDRWYRYGKRRHRGPWSSSYVSLYTDKNSWPTNSLFWTTNVFGSKKEFTNHQFETSVLDPLMSSGSLSVDRESQPATAFVSFWPEHNHIPAYFTSKNIMLQCFSDMSRPVSCLTRLPLPSPSFWTEAIIQFLG